MLLSTKALQRYAIQARDGKIGQVRDLYFSESGWFVRYLVVDVGSWLTPEEVLLVPDVVTALDTDQQQVHVGLSQEQVEDSPPVDRHQPISRQYEMALHEHYAWRPYWTNMYGMPATGTLSVPPLDMIAMEEDEESDLPNPETQQNPLRSAEEIVGYTVGAKDGDVGHVADLVVDTRNWQLRYLVIDTKDWLPGRKVLVSSDWLQDVRWPLREVDVELTRQRIENSPDFESADIISTDYEVSLLHYYDRLRQWFGLDRNDTEKETEVSHMLQGKDLIGNAVVTVSDGRDVGKVKDIYLDAKSQRIAGIYLGASGLLSRTDHYIARRDIVTLGSDAVLVTHADVVHEDEDLEERKTWLRRDELQGRQVDTPGGTRIGRISDVVINREGDVVGFSLGQVFVDGPVADNRSIERDTVVDMGEVDGVVTVNLEQAENQALAVE